MCSHSPYKYIFFIFLGGSHLAFPGTTPGSCTQELLLVVLRGTYGMLGTEPGSVVCKANTLPAVLSLQPQSLQI